MPAPRSNRRRSSPRQAGERQNKHHDPRSSKKRAAREEELIPIIEATKNPLVLVLDQVQDPQNLGACLRTADAAGCCMVVAPKDKSAPLNETVRRIAVGAADSVPYVQVTNLARAIKQMQDAGVWFVGTTDKATQPLYEIDLKGPIGIVMGAEGEGMRRLTEAACDFQAMIPMSGKVPCLNVSVATGVALFEAVRQRSMAKS